MTQTLFDLCQSIGKDAADKPWFEAAEIVRGRLTAWLREERDAKCQLCRAGQPAKPQNGRWWHDHQECAAGPIHDLMAAPTARESQAP